MPSSGYRKQTMDFGEMSRDLQSAAASFTKMSAAAAGFVSLVGAFKTFELEVTRANSAIGGSAKTYKQLSDAARNFALVSKYSAGEAASSMVMLAQAGFDAQETIAAMPHVLQLAQASMENLDLVADTVASTIRTFNMSADEAARVTNVFAASCVNSLATVNKLAFSFRQVGPVAAEMGMNIEETAAALDVLYNRGLRGEQAGTALRNILVRLIKPTQDTLNAFSLLGIGLKNADGSARDLQAILSDLRKSNISDSYLAKIFGREALAASKTLIAATTGEYEKMKESITDTNTVARMANAQMNTLDGALKLIKNSLNEVGIILGQSVGPFVKQVGSMVQDFAIYLRTADSSTISLIKNLGSFVAILGSAKFGIGRVLSELKSLSLVGGKVVSAFSALGSMVIFKQSGAGLMTLKNYADTLRMFEIAKTGGTNWYTNVNEFYKSINNGVGISMKAATEIKNLTTAQVAYMRAVIAGSTATKAFSTALKGLLLSAGKLLVVLAPLMLAFKAYDSYMKERERRQQVQAELFPELEYLDQKIKNLKVTVANDLPALVNKYKEAMETMSQAEETRRRATINEPALQDVLRREGPLFASFNKVGELMREQITTQGYFNEFEIRKLSTELNVPFELVEVYLSNAKKRLESLGAEADKLSKDKLWAVIRNAGYKGLEDYARASLETAKSSEKQIAESKALSEQIITNIISSLRDSNSSLEWLVLKGTNKEQSDRIKKAFVSYILGMSYEDMDKALRENWDKVREVFEKHKDDIPALLKEFKDNFLSVEDQARVVGGGTVETTVNADVKIDPIDTTQQEAALGSLRKAVADMVSDYRISWELLTTESYAQERVAKLDRERSVNRLNTLSKQANLVKQLNNLYQTDETSWKRIKPLLEQADAATGGLVNKNKLLATIYQNQDAEKRKQGALLVEQIDLTAQQLYQQDLLISKEKERYEMVSGRFKYEQEYLQDLSRRIADLDKQATTEVSIENFTNGMEAGFLGVQSQIDSVYQMGKKGMQGFADYLSDSMYGVIDNWDKGWKAVRESLRSTLVEMLKDMAKYFAKMAAYQAVMAAFGGMFGNISASTQTYGVDQLGNSVPIPQTKPTFAAKGGVFKNGLQTFAKGGIVGQPTFFNTRSGKGLMGEAGPEAIVPLKRDRNGNLGVTMQGAGNNYSSTIIINAESGTAQVKSDANYDALAKSLDQQIRGVVLSTLVREKKPGGLLA